MLRIVENIFDKFNLVLPRYGTVWGKTPGLQPHQEGFLQPSFLACEGEVPHSGWESGPWWLLDRVGAVESADSGLLSTASRLLILVSPLKRGRWWQCSGIIGCGACSRAC